MAAEDLRQKNAFIPHIVLEVREEQSERQSTGGLLTVTTRSIRLYARNIGAGFAQNIVAESHSTRSPALIEEVTPLALGVGEEVLLASKSVSGEGTLADYCLTYEDAFGRKFESRIEGVITRDSRYLWKPLSFDLGG